LANLTADHMVRHLGSSGFAIVKKPPAVTILAGSVFLAANPPSGKTAVGKLIEAGRAIELH
jgi:hypothetical protein